MAKPGPKPRPTALKILHGDRKDRIPQGEPIPASGKVTPPSWLAGPALEEWRRYAPDLIAKKVLTGWDVEAFARWCWLTVALAETMTELNAEGLMRGAAKSPRLQVLRDMSTEHRALCGLFGMTPVDRAKLAKTGETDAKKAGADLLSG